MLIVVTTDSENYNAVDITGASDGAFIKERIFTKVRLGSLFLSIMQILKSPASYGSLMRINLITPYTGRRSDNMQKVKRWTTMTCSISAGVRER